MKKGASSCPKCGVPLPHPQHPMAEVSICPKCGKEIRHQNHWGRCVGCGTAYRKIPKDVKRILKVICPTMFGISVEV